MHPFLSVYKPFSSDAAVNAVSRVVRIFIFYHERSSTCVHARVQVMAQIVSKYGSKEKELSARLLKKYGQPLPPSVPPADLRRVLTEFGMEDQDLVAGAAGRARGGEAGPAGTGSGLSTAPAAATAAAEIGERAQGPQRSHLAQAGGAGEGKEEKKKGGRAGEDRGGREGRGEGERREGERRDEQRGRESRAVERAPRGSELDFRSKYFDPLQVRRVRQSTWNRLVSERGRSASRPHTWHKPDEPTILQFL